ncbi:MAG: CinA family protein [Magnetococcus sp. DMHC-6]
MKCLLVIPRWSGQQTLASPSGRPYLDILLFCLGFDEIGLLELTLDMPFDPMTYADEYKLILIQGTPMIGGGRLRRSLLSNLGLSLGLDNTESDRLRVVGARPLYDINNNPSGFAINRRGHMVCYCESSIWEMRREFSKVVRHMLKENDVNKRKRPFSSWMVEGAGESLNLAQFMDEKEIVHCQVHPLPDGDSALMIPSRLGIEFKKRLQTRLGNRLYSTEPLPLEECLGRLLREAKVQVVFAESCTAGLISARLSSVAGSSAYLSSSFVTYSNRSKERYLDVPTVLLERCGAVSPEVALAMARGALRVSGGDLAVSVTGIAGPDGGSPDKPVGTVFLAAVSQDGSVLEHHGFYKGSRDQIRFQTSQTALHLLRRMLINII